jgi:hypothetical protein
MEISERKEKHLLEYSWAVIGTFLPSTHAHIFDVSIFYGMNL